MDAKRTNPWVVAVAVAALVLALATLIVALNVGSDHGPGMMGGGNRWDGERGPAMMGGDYGYRGGPGMMGMMGRGGTCTARDRSDAERSPRGDGRFGGCSF